MKMNDKLSSIISFFSPQFSIVNLILRLDLSFGQRETLGYEVAAYVCSKEFVSFARQKGSQWEQLVSISQCSISMFIEKRSADQIFATIMVNLMIKFKIISESGSLFMLGLND